MEKKRCCGLVGPDHTKPCNRFVDDNEYCKAHEYFSNFSQEEIVQIKTGTVTCCDRCRRWHFGESIRCRTCMDQNNEKKKKAKSDKKCKWKDRNLDPCRKMAFETTEYCDVHQYVIDYTDHMKELSTLCKGCNKIKYLVDGCETCRKRAKQNREKDKTIVKNICKGFIGDKPCNCEEKENGYCGNHQVQFWKITVEKDGNKKVCGKYIRGCRNLLDKNSEYANCDECREKERNNDKNRQVNIKNKCDKIFVINDENKDIISKNDMLKSIRETLIKNNNKTNIIKNDKSTNLTLILYF